MQMSRFHVSGQQDVLCVFSLLCLWPKIYFEHAQILACVTKGAVTMSNDDGRVLSNSRCGERRRGLHLLLQFCRMSSRCKLVMFLLKCIHSSK